MDGEGNKTKILDGPRLDCEYGKLLRFAGICSVCKAYIPMERESQKGKFKEREKKRGGGKKRGLDDIED